MAVGGAAGFAAGTDLGSLVRAAFFCAGSSVVAFATAFGESAFAFGTAGLGESAFGVVGLGDFAFGVAFLEMVPLVLRPLLLGLQLVEAESEACRLMQSRVHQAT